MKEYLQDAKTYVQKYGRPELFITFTCNQNWDEIKNALYPMQEPSDRHDIIARVFRQKLIKFRKVITESCIFGETCAWLYSIEWQKKGLPHAHMLVWLKSRIATDEIDKIISAEIPNQKEDPELFDIVKKFMIHGPCGELNEESPCMKNGKCTKNYPREMRETTYIADDQYPLYKRRKFENGGNRTTLRMGSLYDQPIRINNSWIVPYNPVLSKMFNAHINVEYCTSVRSINYVLKYVHKSLIDQTLNTTVDEIANYQSQRSISSNEAVWRILSFPIHENYPPVISLDVHLENAQKVYFTDKNIQEKMTSPPETTLTAFFKLCQEDEIAKKLFYHEVPEFFTWKEKTKNFQRRVKGTIMIEGLRSSDTLGRVYQINPKTNPECFYLRLLLHNVKGPTSFEDLKTVNGTVCATFREACEKMRLAGEDKMWDDILAEATEFCQSPSQMRDLFIIILLECHPSNPQNLWEKYRVKLSEDFMQKFSSDSERFNQALINMENKCVSISGKSLGKFGLKSLTRSDSSAIDEEILQEKRRSIEKSKKIVLENKKLLVKDQKIAYDKILKSINSEKGEIIFLNAPGGTGKTFLINLILAEIRKRDDIALAMASSGIASTLLDDGCTAHSALNLPFDLASESGNLLCNIPRNSKKGKILKQCKLIVWDECTMAHKNALEAVDKSLKDVRKNKATMGGLTVVLAGDFRQTLPIISGGTPTHQLEAYLKRSTLWKKVKKVTLETNMRVHLLKQSGADEFSKQLLHLGDGKWDVDSNDGTVAFPPNFCSMIESEDDLISQVFQNIKQIYKNQEKHQEWLRERAILAPKNEKVDEINLKIFDLLPGSEQQFVSTDDIYDSKNFKESISSAGINQTNISGFPPTNLKLKVGASIILLRNLNLPKLCNGTRLCVKKIGTNIIEATILTGSAKRENVLIPKIPLVSNKPEEVISIERLQFPVRLAFAVTVDKAQGQSLKVAGLHLEEPCFSHGQLYVACSRVGSPKNLFIYAPNGKTTNVVYPQALN